MASDYKYKRVLLKLSGEALMGEAGYGIDPKVVEELAVQIKEIVDDGIQLAVPLAAAISSVVLLALQKAWIVLRLTTSVCLPPA